MTCPRSHRNKAVAGGTRPWGQSGAGCAAVSQGLTRRDLGGAGKAGCGAGAEAAAPLLRC